MVTLTIILIIFFAVDITITAIYNHYKRIDNNLTKEQNEILWECYRLDAKIIETDHKILTKLTEENGGNNNE